MRIPKKGDKVILLDGFYEIMSDGKECAKLAKLPYCTIESSLYIAIDKGYTYEIYVKETNYSIGLYKDAWEYYEEYEDKIVDPYNKD